MPYCKRFPKIVARISCAWLCALFRRQACDDQRLDDAAESRTFAELIAAAGQRTRSRPDRGRRRR